MQDFRQEINARASMDLEQRRTWYSPVADVYYNARAHYPKELIDPSVALAQLSSDASILEVGCGPGNATAHVEKRTRRNFQRGWRAIVAHTHQNKPRLRSNLQYWTSDSLRV